MGCSKSKNITQNTITGQRLYSVGIPELDELYEKCDDVMIELKERKNELNMCTTNLVRALGAGDFWENGGNLTEIVIMILVVLSAACNGDFNSIGLSLTCSSPYISVRNDKLNFNNRQLVKNFEELVTVLDKILLRIPLLLEKINDLATKCCKFTTDAVKYARSLNFSIEDTLKAVKHIDFNKKKILKAPGKLLKLHQIVEDAKQRICEACEKAEISSYTFIIKMQGLQAHSEGLKSPSSIVKKFWPLINS